MVPWGKASEDCSPCWCAGRRGTEGVPKPNALRREPIQVGGLGHWISSATHEVRPHLIGHDKQDVGLHFGTDRVAPCSKYGEANNEQRVRQTSHSSQRATPFVFSHVVLSAAGAARPAGSFIKNTRASCSAVWGSLRLSPQLGIEDVATACERFGWKDSRRDNRRRQPCSERCMTLH